MAKMMFDPLTGSLMWTVDEGGYEILEPEEMDELPVSGLDAEFLRPLKQESFYRRRGIVRAKGGEARTYKPMEEAPGLARRLAGLHEISPLSNRPTDEEILGFCAVYGLLVPGSAMWARDLIYTAKYLHLFAEAIDAGRKHIAREVFNERVVPRMTVKLAGSPAGRTTTKWTLEVEPIDLIAAAWLQVAQELTHGRKMKKCEAPDCPEWFAHRSNKRFCGNRCKMAWHHHER